MRGFVETPPRVVDSMVDLLFSTRSPSPDDVLLDPGCGTGAFIRGVMRWCQRHQRQVCRIVGIELEGSRAATTRAQFADCPQVEIRDQDFLIQTAGRFDFIIGNPPYVPITGLSPLEKRDFRRRYETANGRFDLYLLFFERAVKSLKPQGRLVFITPEKFLYVASAAPLRRLLSRFRIEDIKLVEEDAFAGLITYPTITSLSHSSPGSATSRRDGRTVRITLNGDGASWMPAILEAGGPTFHQSSLRDVCAKISCGVATGADAIFVQLSSTLDRGLRRFAYPTLAGRELTQRGVLPAPRYSMLIPYTADGRLIDEEALGKLGSYLSRTEIRKRLTLGTCAARKPWYAFHETPSLRDILRPKILCKDISQEPVFWIDRAGALVPRHSIYFIVPNDPSQLDAIYNYLRSAGAVTWLRAHCQRAANGYFRVQSSVLKALPVPQPGASVVRPPRRRFQGNQAYPTLPGFGLPQPPR